MLHIFVSLEICDPLTLDNGMIDCEYGDNGGPNAGDMCSLSCEPGFELSGSDSRTCFENGTWSGEPAICTDGKLFSNDFIRLKCTICMCLDVRKPECFPNTVSIK